MAIGLWYFAQQLVVRGSRGLALEAPVLVWESVELRPGEVPYQNTEAGTFQTRPRTGDALVFELKKGPSKQNAFAVGITVGRAETNDVPIDDVSVSRFHAYFHHDLKTGWKLYDAESSNGTWLGALKLTPKTGEPIGDRSRVRFGDVEMTFYEPKSFSAFLQKRMASGGAGGPVPL